MKNLDFLHTLVPFPYPLNITYFPLNAYSVFPLLMQCKYYFLFSQELIIVSFFHLLKVFLKKNFSFHGLSISIHSCSFIKTAQWNFQGLISVIIFSWRLLNSSSLPQLSPRPVHSWHPGILSPPSDQWFPSSSSYVLSCFWNPTLSSSMVYSLIVLAYTLQ